MKRRPLVCAWVAGSLLAANHAHAEAWLVQDAKPCAEIVVEAVQREGSPVHFAARELQTWIKKITGAELPITDKAGDAPLRLYLGTPDDSETIRAFFPKADAAKIGKTDGFSIRTSGQNAYICGTRPKGVLNGAYQFLHDNTDIVFVRPKEAADGCGTIYGTRKDLPLRSADVCLVPDFDAYRFYSAHSPLENLWQTRLMNLPYVVLGNAKQQGMEDHYRDWGVVFMEGRPSFNAIMSIAEISKTNPEYFPLRKGKRTWNPNWDNFLCWTSQGALETFTEHFMKNVDEGIKNGVTTFDLPHGDMDATCECENCTQDVVVAGEVVAAYADGIGKNPDVPRHMANFNSTRYYLFMNEVAKTVKKKYPQARLRGMAYWITRIPPGIQLEDNIDVVWCPYKKDLRWPITEPSQKLDRYNYPDTFEAWKKVCRGQFFLYEYHFCTQPVLIALPYSDVVQQDLKFYKANNVHGIYFDSNGLDNDTNEFNDCGTPWPRSATYDASAIELWTTSRLMWNLSLDAEKLRDEFCARAFREAAPEMRAYFKMLRESWEQIKLPFHWDYGTKTYNLYLTDIGKGPAAEKLLRDALAKAQHPGSRELIRRQLEVFLKAVGDSRTWGDAFDKGGAENE